VRPQVPYLQGMTRRYPLIALLALAIAMPAIPAYAASDGTINIMTPEQGTVKPGKERQRKQIPRGSSNPVYPRPLPAPQTLSAPQPQQTVMPRRAKLPLPMMIPETGRILPNLPPTSGSGRGGAETFHERATRCTHQAGIYGDAAGNRNAYIGSCINQ
jgi:hypothetical protein